MVLRVLSWNVEHFGASESGALAPRLGRVIDLLQAVSPDVFAILEVSGAEVFDAFTDQLADYSFTISEGPQSQEILVGIRRGLRSFVTQRSEFKRSNPNLRPGMLVTVTRDGRNLPILFNHLKSSSTPEGFGLRAAMLDHARDLARAIRARATARAEPPAFMVMGDLNLMGMNLTYAKGDITAPQEIARTAGFMAEQGLRLLSKTHPATWSGGPGSSYPDSDLDHVLAFREMAFLPQPGGAEVRVAGWAELTGQARTDWLASHSDHAPLILDVDGF